MSHPGLGPQDGAEYAEQRAERLRSQAERELSGLPPGPQRAGGLALLAIEARLASIERLLKKR